MNALENEASPAIFKFRKPGDKLSGFYLRTVMAAESSYGHLFLIDGKKTVVWERGGIDSKLAQIPEGYYVEILLRDEVKTPRGVQRRYDVAYDNERRIKLSDVMEEIK